MILKRFGPKASAKGVTSKRRVCSSLSGQHSQTGNVKSIIPNDNTHRNQEPLSTAHYGTEVKAVVQIRRSLFIWPSCVRSADTHLQFLRVEQLLLDLPQPGLLHRLLGHRAHGILGRHETRAIHIRLGYRKQPA